MRGTVYTSFIFAKQPKRIRQVSGGILLDQRAASYIEQITTVVFALCCGAGLIEVGPLIFVQICLARA